MQSYYAINDTEDIIAQNQAGIVQYPYLTYGTFSTNLTPITRYGLPLAVKMGGVVMDIDKILHTKVEVNNDREKLTAYNLSRGPSYSLNENLVPEQLFDNPETQEKEADGISATKALSLAAQQGQTIYTITKANYAEILPKLNHSDVVMTDIRNGVNAGKIVTVHDTQITLNGWSGTGYTILDPESGAGAYMIGGGLDGGFTDVDDLRNGFLFISTLLLSTSDFFTNIDGTVKSKWYISETLKQKSKLGRWSARAGVLGAVVANIIVAADSDLSLSSKVGQIVINTLSFGAISALVPLLATGFLGFALLMLATVAISYLASYINSNFFAYRNNSRKMKFKIDYSDSNYVRNISFV